jgi:PAS domain S-box-containing protein
MSSTHRPILAPPYQAGKSPAAKPGLGKNGSHTGDNADKVSILVVDDRPDKLLALEACLSSLGQNIVRAHSGPEALKHLLKQEFAVILLDVSMPGMDGFETATLIRQRPKTEHVPIIFVTSMSDSEKHIFKGYSLGAVDYILSPIIPDVLRTKVSVFVDLYKKAEQIRRQGEQLRQLQQAEHKRELAAVEDRLEAETKRNRFFTLALDLLAIADFDGRFLQLNPVWEKTLGYTEEELKARTGLEFVHPDDRAAMAAQLERLRKGNCITSFEGRYRCKDGSYRWLGWTASATGPVGDPDASDPDRAEALIYIFARDITTRKEHEAAIEQLNTQLEHRVQQLTDANAELEAFNYTISHDLRSPLRSMQGFAQALVEDCSAELGDTGRNYTRRIMTSSQYMDTLLQDLLKYSRLSRTEMDRAQLDLQAIVNEVVESLNREIRDKSATIEVPVPLLSVCGNLSAVKQVLANLLTNALKFVPPERHPHIIITTTTQQLNPPLPESSAAAAPPESVRISIQDNGIGIATEHQEKIFGLFERLHNSTTYPGTGVGLAIVRKAVERMGGRVGLQSQPGEGSRFWVELPSAFCFAPDDPEPAVAAATG